MDDPSLRPQPLRISERCRKLLKPDSHLQNELISLHAFTNSKLQKIKEAKTCVMKFNFAQNYDFPVELSVPGFKNFITIVEEVKLLGIVLTNDLKWEANTSYICTKAMKKMWILRRLKRLNLDIGFLVDVYKKEVRSLLEIAVPAWHSGLTVDQVQELERIQKVAMSIILGKKLPSDQARHLLELEPLADRREKICLKFAKKTLSSKHAEIFTRNRGEHNNNTSYLQH